MRLPVRFQPHLTNLWNDFLGKIWKELQGKGRYNSNIRNILQGIKERGNILM